MAGAVKRASSELISSTSSKDSPEKKGRYERNDVEEWGVVKVTDFLRDEGLDFAVKPFTSKWLTVWIWCRNLLSFSLDVICVY